jgi:hypothetical protein
MLSIILKTLSVVFEVGLVQKITQKKTQNW